ncbi:hypothetical protein K505DRAFT_259478 [Melanomma pulvis-pyrius CBS 109.77]|uniref:Uncharacterized protein n=1 Tax=Melanomma pulvis-pyrius CBS 109.77 TaxID=1314802 RepID=A0A6A6WRA8_9PLEO|nr:hypothetical protein K505DRAFT_259478 [Melanomma pulvis-pyrius CBS 109.77]
MKPKAIRAREKALGEKFEEVQSRVDNQLEKGDGVVVDCFYHARTKLATMDKAHNYTHLMKLQSNNPFVLIKQVILEEGPYAGNVAIILKQGRAFPVMRLPIAIRTKILHFMLVHDDAISIALRQNTRHAYSPNYKGKNNLAILSTCKQLQGEATPIVYNQMFHFTGTEVIANFLLQIRMQNRAHLRSLRSNTYNSASAKTMFHLLEDAPQIQHISFAHVSSNEKPMTATKNIFNDASQWLLTLDKQNPTKGLDILSFDDTAFHMREKDEEGNVMVTQWGPGEQIDFLKGFKLKLKQAARKQ